MILSEDNFAKFVNVCGYVSGILLFEFFAFAKSPQNAASVKARVFRGFHINVAVTYIQRFRPLFSVFFGEVASRGGVGFCAVPQSRADGFNNCISVK